jgi:hypothetical protein
MTLAKLCWLCIAIAGCFIPAIRVFRARLEGEVMTVEGNNRVPLSGAAILVETWAVETPGGAKWKLKDVLQTRTDENGRFIIPEKAERMWVGIAPDLGPAFNRRLCIRKDGYRTVVADPWASDARNPWSYSVPTLYVLERAGPPPETDREQLSATALRATCFPDTRPTP